MITPREIRVQNPKMMKQLQEMQQRMAKMQEDLGEVTVIGTAGGGAVSVEADGQQRILSVAIAPEALDDADLLGDMVMAACNDALDKARDAASNQMGQLTAGLKLPPGLL